ncbi:hypothetical protein [Thioalkalivibrio sp.]|uniref:hypothetical protein n=1 Tax=Thioalkalivibrio sp. TaxID=2093813 RepID=UPI0035677EFA
MSTKLPLIVLGALLILLTVSMLIRSRRQGLRDRKALLAGLMIPVMMLLLWLAVMVFGGEPGPRKM